MNLQDDYDKGKVGSIYPATRSNPTQLNRWRKREGVGATGKYIDGEYYVVFWNRIKEQNEY